MSQLAFHGRTDVGLRRKHNEDAYLISEDENLFCVADGLGGYAAGEVASALAIDAIGNFFSAVCDDEELTWPADADHALTYHENLFMNAVYQANRRVWSAAHRYAAYRGMGTTMVGIHFEGGRYYVAHVGDSRCYRLRDGRLEQVTEDHSLLNAFRKSMDMDDEAARAFPYKNVILRALGQEDQVEVDVQWGEWRAGDVFLLCSDGLTDEVEDPDIERILNTNRDLGHANRELIAAANASGGRDNITALLVKVPDDHYAPIMRVRRASPEAEARATGTQG